MFVSCRNCKVSDRRSATISVHAVSCARINEFQERINVLILYSVLNSSHYHRCILMHIYNPLYCIKGTNVDE